jgi:hypothetical protein
MNRFVLKHIWEDETKDTHSNVSEFSSDILYEDLSSSSSRGILSHMEDFLRGSGFVFNGHLEIVEEE